MSVVFDVPSITLLIYDGGVDTVYANEGTFNESIYGTGLTHWGLVTPYGEIGLSHHRAI